MKEIWKNITGYDGLYQVNNLGMVRSLWYNRIKILKQYVNKGGYKCVVLCKDNKKKLCTVHRLVARAFIPNPDNLPQVNHKDENKLNNNVDNLEWCDGKYNSNYGTAIQRMIEKQLNDKEKSKPVLQFTKSGEFVREYQSQKEAQRQTGINQRHISHCCNNSQYKKYGRFYTVKTAGGYIWRHKENGGD